MKDHILAWHFVGDKLRDGSPVPKNGVWLKHNGPVILCQSGLHASLDPFDALQYAPGATLCRVALRGEVTCGEDKIAASERMIICRMDATEMLRYFARMQAVSVLDNWAQCPPDAVLDYLMTGDECLRSAAESAAWSAAWSAAESAESAAGSAAWSAAWSAESATWSAAWSAESATWSAARAAARAAAWSAAWSAESATWSAAREDFNALVNECFGL